MNRFQENYDNNPPKTCVATVLAIDQSSDSRVTHLYPMPEMTARFSFLAA